MKYDNFVPDLILFKLLSIKLDSQNLPVTMPTASAPNKLHALLGHYNSDEEEREIPSAGAPKGCGAFVFLSESTLGGRAVCFSEARALGEVGIWALERHKRNSVAGQVNRESVSMGA